jgi:hypothetical protein
MTAAKRSADRPARVPAHRLRGRRVRRAHRLQQRAPARDGAVRGQVQRAALGAQAAEVGRVLRVAAHAGDLRAVVSMITPQPTPQ